MIFVLIALFVMRIIKRKKYKPPSLSFCQLQQEVAPMMIHNDADNDVCRVRYTIRVK